MVDQVKGTVPCVLRVGKHADRTFLQLFFNEAHGNNGQAVVGENGMLHSFRERRFDPAADPDTVCPQIVLEKGTRPASLLPHYEVHAFQIGGDKGAEGGKGVIFAVSQN